MADSVAAPVAPAANTTTTPDAAPAAEPKAPANPFANLEAELKKAGGLKVKVNGKERAVDSVEAMRRGLERGLAIEDSLGEVTKQREELEKKIAPRAKLLDDLTSEDPQVARAAAKKLFGPRFLDLAAAEIQEAMAAEAQHKDEHPEAKRWRMQAENERAQREALEGQRKEFEAKQQAAQQQAQTNAVLKEMSDATIAALKLADIDPKDEPEALQVMLPLLQKMIYSGVKLDPQILAEAIEARNTSNLQWHMKKMGPAGIAKLLGSDFEKAYRKVLLEKHAGAGKAATPAQNGEQPAQQAGANPAFGSPSFWKR